VETALVTRRSSRLRKIHEEQSMNLVAFVDLHLFVDLRAGLHEVRLKVDTTYVWKPL
jgi:hypothetical protein